MDHMAIVFMCLSVCVLSKVQTAYSPTYGHCTDIRNEQTGLLEGLICSFDQEIFEMQEKIPPISTLLLNGVGCSQDWDIIRWVIARLQSPQVLEVLSVRRCQGIRIGENDMATLQNLRELQISDGTLNFIHSKAFSSLKLLHSVSLVRLKLGHFPNAATGHFNSSSINHTDTNLPGLPVQRLDLSGNAIIDIPADTFIHLPNLTHLDLAHNRLRRLYAEPFQYLEQLEMLNVSLNSISALPSLGFASVLPRLQVLVMRNANIPDLRMNSFAGLNSLRVLDLSKSTINILHPLALQGLDRLEEINFLFNPLRSVPQDFLQPVNSTLRKVSMSECKLSTIPQGFLEKLQKLEEVDLSKNVISSLQNISFRESPRLQMLNVAFNAITEIPLHFFDQTMSIETVHLEGNSICQLQTHTFSNLKNLRDANLAKNNLTTLSWQAFYNLPSLHSLDLSSNFLLWISVYALYNIASLQELNLANNYLTNFPRLPYVNKEALNPILHPDKAVVIDMLDNWLRCDCDMYSLLVNPEYTDLFWPGANQLANLRFKNYQELKCSWPPPLINHILYDPKQDNMLDIWLFFRIGIFSCPAPCQCYTRCRDYMNITLCSNANLTSVPWDLSGETHILNLANNELSMIPSSSFSHMKYVLQIDLRGNLIAEIGNMFTGLTNLNTIYLGQNKITAISGENFKGLFNMTFLDLHQNSISVIEPDSFADLKKLQYLYLDHNLIKGLQWKALNNSQSLKEITLHNNPLICDCDLIWLKDWLQTETNILENTDSINCTTKSNQTGAVVYFDDYEFMCNTTDTKTHIPDQLMQAVAICLGVLVVLMSTFAVVYRFRKVIQVIVYNRTGLRFHNKADKDTAKIYLYDAFISFCSDDLDFVTQELVPKLECPQTPFRLCIHQRDFVVGECISTNIINAVESSRRTVIVLSNNYVTSEWCSFEFKAAHQQLLKDHRNRIIIILLEEVDRSILDKDLRLYLSTNTYLERKDSLFWEKLYYAMPDKKRVGLDQRQDEPNSMNKENGEHVEVELQEDLQQLII